MTDFAHAHAGESNLGSAKCSADFSWSEFFKQIFPKNTAASVASLTRTNVRSIEHVLSGRNSLSGRALTNLLRSSLGPQVLNFLAGDVDWRAVEQRRLAVIELENELEAAKQKRSALERELLKSRDR